MIESSKNGQIDDIKNENHSLRDEIAQLKEKTKYLCRKRGNRNQDLLTACETGFPYEWRGGQYHHGRQQ
jgi:hypothetical protein